MEQASPSQGRDADRARALSRIKLAATLLLLSTAAMVKGVRWAVYFDPAGLASVLTQVSASMHTHQLSIGVTGFDARKPPKSSRHDTR